MLMGRRSPCNQVEVVRTWGCDKRGLRVTGFVFQHIAMFQFVLIKERHNRIDDQYE